MPCTDGGPSHSDYLQARVDLLAALLCAACRAFDAGAKHLPADVQKWWLDHQEQDRDLAEVTSRLAAEAKARRDFLATLSPEQRRLLGLR